MNRHKRGEAPAERDVKWLGKLRNTHLIAPVVLTDGMAAAIRGTHLIFTTLASPAKGVTLIHSIA